MTANLAECTERCEWALMHATQFLERLNAFEKREDVFRRTHILHRETGWLSIIFEPSPVPRELSLMFGDVLHNLRSALDHMVWQLAISNGNTPPPFPLSSGDPWERLQFPIFSTKQRYREGEGRYLHGLSDAAKAFIKARQPFQDTKYMPLSLLATLSNIDKHRMPHLGASLINRIDLVPQCDPSDAEPDETWRIEVPAIIKGRTKVAAMHFDPIPNRANARVKVQFAVTIDEASGFGQDKFFAATLGQIGRLVQTIIFEAGRSGL